MKIATDVKLDSRARRQYEFVCLGHSLELGRQTKIMGIINLTDDSFSKDGIYRDPARAEDLALSMEQQGADIIDVGGESTRPGARIISAQEQKERVLPVIRKITKKLKVPVSIDTTNSEVARAALAEGAVIVNDISALGFDARMAAVVAESGAGCVLMHIQGTPRTMQQNPVYESLIEEIIDHLKECVSKAINSGIDRKMLIVDPGIGFGKTTQHNLEIINRLNEFSCLDLPVLVGPSRKSFIGNVLNLPVEQRLLGTVASVVAAILNGAHIVRVHDVGQIRQAVRMTDAVLNCQT